MLRPGVRRAWRDRELRAASEALGRLGVLFPVKQLRKMLSRREHSLERRSFRGVEQEARADDERGEPRGF